MAGTLLGLHSWSGGRDEQGHRTYNVDWLVRSAITDGPEAVSGTPGLPGIGVAWNFGGDSDSCAFNTPVLKIDPLERGEPNEYWLVGQIFTTKPIENNKNKNPCEILTWTPEVSGSFVRFMKEAVEDYNGKPILSSSHERYKGAVVERDYARHQINIKMFSATLNLATYAQYINNVNSLAMWGLGTRCVKLSNVSWKVLFYGSTYASKYYEITYEFDIDFDTFDRRILDEGTRTLKPYGDPTKPADFVPYLIKGQPSSILLDGSGNALTDINQQYYHVRRLYKEKNLLLLGVPTSF